MYVQHPHAYYLALLHASVHARVQWRHACTYQRCLCRRTYHHHCGSRLKCVPLRKHIFALAVCRDVICHDVRANVVHSQLLALGHVQRLCKRACEIRDEHHCCVEAIAYQEVDRSHMVRDHPSIYVCMRMRVCIERIHAYTCTCKYITHQRAHRICVDIHT